MREAVYRLAYLGLAPVRERENRWQTMGRLGRCATVMCTTSFHPPLWRALQNFKFGTRIQSRLVATNCTE
jgi:hypothetical protein